MMEVFRSTWEAARPEHTREAEWNGQYVVFCFVCNKESDHPWGEATFIRMEDGDVRYICPRCVHGGSAHIGHEFRKQADRHRELTVEYQGHAKAPVSIEPAARKSAQKELEQWREWDKAWAARGDVTPF
jgi:hypothetical protein